MPEISSSNHPQTESTNKKVLGFYLGFVELLQKGKFSQQGILTIEWGTVSITRLIKLIENYTGVQKCHLNKWQLTTNCPPGVSTKQLAGRQALLPEVCDWPPTGSRCVKPWRPEPRPRPRPRPVFPSTSLDGCPLPRPRWLEWLY